MKCGLSMYERACIGLGNCFRKYYEPAEKLNRFVGKKTMPNDAPLNCTPACVKTLVHQAGLLEKDKNALIVAEYSACENMVCRLTIVRVSALEKRHNIDPASHKLVNTRI